MRWQLLAVPVAVLWIAQDAPAQNYPVKAGWAMVIKDAGIRAD